MATPSTAILFMPAATAHGIEATRIMPTALSAPTILPTTYTIACGPPYVNYPGLSCAYHDVTIITTPPASTAPLATAAPRSGLPEPNFSFQGFFYGLNVAQDARCYIESTTQLGYCIKTIRDAIGNTKIETATGKDVFTNFYLRDMFATVTVIGEAIEAAVATATEVAAAVEAPAAAAASVIEHIEAPEDTAAAAEEAVGAPVDTILSEEEVNEAAAGSTSDEEEEAEALEDTLMS